MRRNAPTIAFWATVGFSASSVPAVTPNALPTGGQVVAGTAQINQTAKQMTITQSSNRLITNWSTFNIGSDALVRFVQPGASSVALNRILDASPTEIFGHLCANGQVFLLNPNGVIFGATAQVNVGGLVASSLSISNADFLAGRYVFTNAGSAGRVQNQGSLNAPGGVVALIAPQVSNTGNIKANAGSAVLASGDTVSLDFQGDGLVTVNVDKGTFNALAENQGLIQADGGHVVMTAKSADALLETVVNNEGVVRAQTLENRSGHILLLGDMDHGRVQVGGTLDASAPHGGDGGFIETSASVVALNNPAITTLAAHGKTGDWLIDPLDLTIDSTGASALSSALASTNVTVTTSSAAYGTNSGTIGDIIVNAPITKSGGPTTTLSLQADQDVVLNANVSSTGGALNLELSPNSNGILTGAVLAYADINTNGGYVKFNYNGGPGAGTGTYFGGGSAQSVTTGGGAVEFYGDVMIANTYGVTVNTSGGDVSFYGRLDSGNSYGFVNTLVDWTTAYTAAQSGSGANVGDTYLATIASALENNVAGAASGFTTGWLGARRVTGIGTNAVWRWVAGPPGLEDGGKGRPFFTQNGSDSVNGNGGTPIGGAFSNWLSGEPNNIAGANLSVEDESVVVFNAGVGAWNDLPKTGVFYPYITETRLAPSSLAINAGSGTVTFNDKIGSLKPLASLSVTGSTIAMNAGSVTTVGTQTYAGSVILGADTSLITTNSAINFADTLDSDPMAHDLTLSTGSGITTFSGAVGGNSPLATLTADAAEIDGSAITTSGAQVYNGAVRLGYLDPPNVPSMVTLTTTDSNVTFNGAINAALGSYQDLTVSAGAGTVTFNGVVGGTAELGGLFVTGPTVLGADMRFGRVEFMSPVALSRDVTITQTCCYGTHFHSTVDGAHNLILNTTGSAFDGDVGGTTPLTSLDATGEIYLSANVTTTGTQTYRNTIYLLGQNETLSQTDANTDFVLRSGLDIINWVGDTTFAIKTTRDIVLQGSNSISSATTGKVNVLLNSRAADGSSGAIIMNATADGGTSTPISILSNGGTIQLVGGSSAADYAIGGTNAYTFGTDAHQDGISLGTVTLDSRVYTSGVPESAGGGDVTLKSKGYAGNVTLHGGGLWDQSSAIYTGGGNATLDLGAQRSGSPTTGGIRYGGYLQDLTVQTDGGNIKLTTPTNSASDTGMYLVGTTSLDSGTGDITLTTDTLSTSTTQSVQGTGLLQIQPYSVNASIGVGAGAGTLSLPQQDFWNGTAGIIKNGFSAIIVGRIDGTGDIIADGLTFSDPLLLLSGGANANATLAGAIANAGTGSSSGIFAVKVGGAIGMNDGTTITTQNQAVVFDADSDEDHAGSIGLGNGTRINTNGGDIILGGGANPLTTPAYGDGVHSEGIVGFNLSNPWNGLDGSQLDAGGGNITAHGHTDRPSDGVDLNVNEIWTTTGSGTITIVGSAGPNGHQGLVLDRATITTENGDISVTGTAGGSSYLALSYQAGNVISTTTGAIHMTGIGGQGIFLNTMTVGGATEAGDITLTADTIDLGGGSLQSSGALTLEPYTAGTIIGVAGGSGALSVPASAFSTNIIDGFSSVTIGNGTAGAITVGGPITLGNNTAFVSGDDINMDSTVNAAGRVLTLTGGSGATVHGNGSITAAGLLLNGTNATYALNTAPANNIGTLAAANPAAVNFENDGSFIVGTVGGVSGVTAGGAVTLEAHAAAADLTLNQFVMSGSGDVVLAAGRNFLNNNTIDTGIDSGSGRYLVYSTDPADSTPGMTGYSKHYAQSYNAGSIPSYASSGSWFLYSVAPVLSVSAGPQTISYGNVPSYTPGFTGLIGGDTAASAGITGSASYTVGGSHSTGGYSTVGTHDVTYLGGLASNLGYTFQDNASLTNELTVNRAPLAVTGIAAGDKTYDTNRAAALAGSPIVSGLAGDLVNVTGTGSGTFVDKNVGTAKSVTVTGYSLTGADASNYQIVQPGGVTASITPVMLTVSGVTAADKVYDATTTAALSGIASVNALRGDSVSLAGPGRGSFLDKNTGTAKPVTVTGYALTGPDAVNYQLTQPEGITADITPALLTLNGLTAANKLFDGSASATVTSFGTLKGVKGSDNVTLNTTSATASFANSMIGYKKPVTVDGLTLGGADAGNYALAPQLTTAGIGIVSNSSVESVATSLYTIPTGINGTADTSAAGGAEHRASLNVVRPGLGAAALSDFASDELVEDRRASSN